MKHRTSSAIIAMLVLVCAILCWKVVALESRLDHSGTWITSEDGYNSVELTLEDKVSENFFYTRRVELDLQALDFWSTD